MNIKGHFETITRHKLLVMKYCFACGLYEQGLAHDLSKYSPTEFIPGCIYYQGDHSPNEAERLARGYSSAWLHHKGRNKHHLAYWIDYSLSLIHILLLLNNDVEVRNGDWLTELLRQCAHPGGAAICGAMLY